MLLASLLATLGAHLGVLDDDIKRCLLVVAWGMAKFGRLIAGGIPESVIVLTLAWVPHAAFRLCDHVSLVSLSTILGFDALAPLPLRSLR
jgi:hypothetical protein